MTGAFARPEEARKEALVVRLLRLGKRKTARYAGFTFEEALAEAQDLFGPKENGWDRAVRYQLAKLRETNLLVRVGAKKNTRYVDPSLEDHAKDLLRLYGGPR